MTLEHWPSEIAALLPWWGWLLFAWGCLLAAGVYRAWRRAWGFRASMRLWRAREDMEAALWSELDAETARRLAATKDLSGPGAVVYYTCRDCGGLTASLYTCPACVTRAMAAKPS